MARVCEDLWSWVVCGTGEIMCGTNWRMISPVFTTDDVVGG